MKAVTGKQLARTLERHGWELRPDTGSHHICAKADTAVRLSVPIHGNRPLKTGLARHLLKMADLSEEDV